MAESPRSRWSPRARVLVWPLLVIGAALFLTACEAPRIVTVTTFVDGSDANPGDGVCEMTVGAGDCSLRAAIDTSNAAAGSTPVTVVVPSGTYTLSLAGSDDANTMGDLDVVAGSHGVVIEGSAPGVRIDASGAEAAFDVRSPLVDLKGLAVTGASGPGLVVHSGQARVYRGASFANAGAGVEVAAGASLSMESSTLSGNGAGGASVAGTFNVSYSTVTANVGGGIIGAGTTNAGANLLADQLTGPDCAIGTAVSNGGYNLDSDGSCGLGGSFDVTVADAGLAPLNGALVPFHRPQPGSPAIDVIGTGAYCGGPNGPRDATNAARPIGPDCDRGAIEADYTAVPTANADTATVGEDGPGATVDVLANDTDPDTGDRATVTAVDITGTVGSVVNNGVDVTYDPNGAFEALAVGETATDTFSYTMTDAAGNTAGATVTVTITGANDGPTANADNATVDASGPAVTVAVLGNDSDPDTTDTLSVQSVDTTGTLGSVTNNGTDITYDPNGQFPNDPNSLWAPAAVPVGATDTFTYTAVDPSGATSTATVTITVTGINHAPVAVDDSANADEDGPAVTVDVVGNDTDADLADTKAVQSVDTTGTSGSVTNNGTDVSYDPNGAFESLGAGATATDTFTYTVVDSHAATDTATVTVTVTGQNDAPVAVADVGSVGEDGPPVTVFVLDNDTDPDALDAKTVQSVDNTGTLGQGQTFGTFVGYDPGSAFNHLTQGATATDTFSYTMVDGSGATATATVTVTITGANDAPMASNDLGMASEDGPGVTVDVLGNDTDPDTGDTKAVDDVNTSTTLGSVTNNGTDVTYNPNGKFESLQFGQTATDTFSYRVEDGAGATATASVTVTVSGVNDAPVAVADSASANEDGPPVLIGVLGNDTDKDSGETKAVQSVDTTGTLGAVTPLGASVGYDPNGAFNALKAGATATDTFSYTMVDSQGATSTATVTVTVTGQNDAPTAVDDSAATNEDANNVAIAVLGNDTDPDSGDTKTVQSVGALSNGGSVTNNGTNVTFTPGAAFQDLQVGSTRQTSFSYTMVDGSGATSSATVTVTVSGVNDAPVATNDGTYNGVVGNTSAVLGVAGTGPYVTLSGNVLTQNDTDVDAADTKTASLVAANSANVTVNANGSFTYTPPVGTQNTNVTFTYKVTDSQGADSNAGTVTLNVVERVWYVNNTLGSNGDGRSTSPFNALAAAAATDDANDTVFLYSSATAYAGGLVMTSNEQLLGEPHGLTVTGAASAILAATAGAHPTVTNSAGGGHAITLANGANIQRVNVSGANTDGITGSSITGATIGSAGNLITISGSGGAELKLTGAAGGSIDINATITNGGAGRAVEIQNRNAGTITFNGAISDSGGTGVFLNSNTGATFNFTAAVVLATGGNPAFTATAGGTVTTSNAVVNTITTTTGTALNVDGTAIGGGGLTFQSINAGTAASGPTNGIVLNQTGSSGGLTVTGTGGAGTGGTIQRTSASGIRVTNSVNLNLSRMNLTNATLTDGGGANDTCSRLNVSTCNAPLDLDTVTAVNLVGVMINGSEEHGIVGREVTGFTLASGAIQNAGNAVPESGAYFLGLYGTVSVTNSTISGNAEDNFSVLNTSGTSNMTFTGNTVSSNSSIGNDGILVDSQGTANITALVQNNTFAANKGDHVQFTGGSTVAGNVTIRSNTMTGGHATGLGQGITLRMGASYAGTFTYDIDGNSITGAISTAVNTGFGSTSAGGLLRGKVRNNIIGTSGVTNSGSVQGSCILVEANGPGTGTHTASITGNTLRRCFDKGIDLLGSRDGSNNLNVTVTGNNVNELVDASSRWAIRLETGSSLANETGTVCADISGNTLNAATIVTEMSIRQRSLATIRLPGYTGSTTDDAAVVAYLQARNPAGGTAAVTHTATPFTNTSPAGSACPTPP